MLKNYSKICFVKKDISDIKYAKPNRVRLNEGKRSEITKMFIEFFNEVEGKTKGMKGYMIMDNIQDANNQLLLLFGIQSRIWMHIINLIINLSLT
jgi:hypothetical protein